MSTPDPEEKSASGADLAFGRLLAIQNLGGAIASTTTRAPCRSARGWLLLAPHVCDCPSGPFGRTGERMTMQANSGWVLGPKGKITWTVESGRNSLSRGFAASPIGGSRLTKTGSRRRRFAACVGRGGRAFRLGRSLDYFRSDISISKVGEAAGTSVERKDDLRPESAIVVHDEERPCESIRVMLEEPNSLVLSAGRRDEPSPAEESSARRLDMKLCNRRHEHISRRRSF